MLEYCGTGKDESEGLIAAIRQLIQEFLKNERCVILAVVPANVDFHNSQILQDAKAEDPTTRRTLPVITKPDLVDEGAEQGVIDLLCGRKTRDFKLGFHAVKCRGQKDLDASVDIATGLQREKEFFQEHPIWGREGDIADLVGIPRLKNKLSDLYMTMVQEQVTPLSLSCSCLRRFSVW